MKKKADTATLAGKYTRALAVGKAGYRRADAALNALTELMKPGDIVVLRGGKKFKLVDQFSAASVVYKPVGVHRFKLEEIVTL
jgi:hypothetical protein